MPKPAVIDTPFPTVAEVARLYGISAAERKRIERSVERFLSRDAATSRRVGRRTLRKAVARKIGKK